MLQRAAATRRRRSLHKGACTFSLGFIHFRTHIVCDNKGALLLAGQGSYSSRSKHLASSFEGLRDWIMDEKLVMDHVSTKSQLGDILTKFLARSIFTKLLNAIINMAYNSGAISRI